MHQWNTEIPQWNRYYHWWSLMRLWFLFSLFLKTDFRLFMNSGLKVLPKRLKCSILVWNYSEDVNVLRWNRWRHLLRWHNAFFCTRRQADYHWLRDFLCTDFLHFIDLNAILPHFLRKTFILAQYYAPPKHAEQDQIDAKCLGKRLVFWRESQRVGRRFKSSQVIFI